MGKKWKVWVKIKKGLKSKEDERGILGKVMGLKIVRD